MAYSHLHCSGILLQIKTHSHLNSANVKWNKKILLQLGPYKVQVIHANGFFDLDDFAGNVLPTRLNGNRVKVYRK